MLDGAFSLLAASVESGLVPGAAASVGTVDGRVRGAAFGFAQVDPERRPLTLDALFDVASLTKVAVTTTLLLRAVERGLVSLDQRVASVLPAFGAAGKERVTFRHLAAHTSGLPAWRDLYSDTGSRREALDAVWRAPLARPAGSAVVYSDLGFISLGEALATAFDAPLDRLARDEVFAPLKMADSRYRPAEAHRARCVATEVVARRGGALVGEVHDDNAAALGGVAGHAGLFTTLDDLDRFCQMWLGADRRGAARVLSAAAVHAATRDQTGGVDPAARRGLGWVLQPNPLWPAADLAAPPSYSHTGYTGTSIVIDPIHGLYAVLLTNRVHPSAGDDSAERVRTLRARFHNAVWAGLT